MCALVTAGCLVASEKSVHTEGRAVVDSVMSALELGVTSEAQLLELLGSPSRTMVADDGGTIYVWSWRHEERGEGRVFLLFSGESEKSSEGSAGVLVRSGLVQKWWIDPAHSS